MWFMNKIANPVVRLILGSPLHRILSAAVLLITYRGRKSNKPYTLPVQYVQNGKVIYILPGMPEKKTWWRNLRGGIPVWVTLRGETRSGRGMLLDPTVDADESLTSFGLYLKRFPGLAKVHHVRVEADGSFNSADLRQVSPSVLVVRVDLE
jgi:deazaflavin-dependent oxidoreductase (nitroreductase family)